MRTFPVPGRRPDTWRYSNNSVGGGNNVQDVGGLCARNGNGSGHATNCYWDVEASGQTTSAGGTGLTTTSMQMLSTFTDASWDFIGETANGMEDIWVICEGTSYPVLTWEYVIGYFDRDFDTDFADFSILADRWSKTDGSFWCVGLGGRGLPSACKHVKVYSVRG